MEYRDFKLVTNYSPTGDQPEAIEQLVKGIKENKKYQVLLGATGTGKTFTVSNVIARINKPTLVLVHNKTLAGQLYSEFKELFPENRVEYFVSNFDFYQPEAYMPSTDTYIEKNAQMNDELEIMRCAAINSVLERSDTIIVASVASIYGLSDPDEYRELAFVIHKGEELDRKKITTKLIASQYVRNNMTLKPGTFRFNGDVLEIVTPNSKENVIRVLLDEWDEVESIHEVDSLTGEIIHTYNEYPIFPSHDHAAGKQVVERAVKSIREELAKRLEYFHNEGKYLEEERLSQRTRYDMEQLLEFGFCSGIENYSRHIDGRKEGETPYTLFDYFPEDFLLIVDESHVSFSQVRGMYNGDRSRKTTLVEYGFRLPSALDNRPLNFEEFESKINQVICTSATPGDYELNKTGGEVVEQIIRPTGLVDPIVEVKDVSNPVFDLVGELDEVIEKNERAMVVTLTIKDAENLTSYLKERGYKVAYLHNETKTLERTEIIYQLRKGKYDVLVGINLLREGLDIPEVSLIAILDADKEGFLRSERSLIQIIGRAARNVNGRVIMYASRITDSMKGAITETNRRRAIQEAYNKENGIVPKTIVKPIVMPLHVKDNSYDFTKGEAKLTRKEKENRIKEVEKEMREAARQLDFERAATLRDILFELKSE
ncbi:MAG: excinuclease ABC subunit UvrB [Erysipelotrichaceae bacterium]|nr:excinuclease ABC subunit UvrB [Erysipelotrichaceae bacterium]